MLHAKFFPLCLSPRLQNKKGWRGHKSLYVPPPQKKRKHGREGRKCYLWETGELVRVQAGALLAGGMAIVGWTAALSSRALFYGTLTIQ